MEFMTLLLLRDDVIVTGFTAAGAGTLISDKDKDPCTV